MYIFIIYQSVSNKDDNGVLECIYVMSYAFLTCTLTAHLVFLCGWRLPRDTHMSLFPVVDATLC